MLLIFYHPPSEALSPCSHAALVVPINYALVFVTILHLPSLPSSSSSTRMALARSLVFLFNFINKLFTKYVCSKLLSRLLLSFVSFEIHRRASEKFNMKQRDFSLEFRSRIRLEVQHIVASREVNSKKLERAAAAPVCRSLIDLNTDSKHNSNEEYFSKATTSHFLFTPPCDRTEIYLRKN